MVELLPFQVLQDDVDRVFSFVYALQLHNVHVADLPHQLNFVLQRLLSLIARVLLLFGKGLHGHHLMVSQPLGQVHSREGPLPDLLLCFEKLMEVSLVDFLFEFEGPLFSYCGVTRVEGELFCAPLAFELDGSWYSQAGLILCDGRCTSNYW